MITPKLVRLQLDPTGSVTINITGTKENGEVVVGNIGGVPAGEVFGATALILDLLTRSQAHVSTLYSAQAEAVKALTSGSIKA